MKTVIYYFTGTGNSLAAAKKISAAIGDCEIVSIASMKDTNGPVCPDADRIGIVCPVYFLGLPAMVASFAGQLDLSHSQYTFAVVTFRGPVGSSALGQLDTILKTRDGHGLDAGFMVKMPGNYILMYESPVGKKRDTLLAIADEELAGIAGAVSRSEHRKFPSSVFAGIFHALMYHRFISHVNTDDRKFSVTDACTSCGTCAAICPAGNIKLVDGKPVWQHHCELCCGCIHICPVEAIQAGPRTSTRQRYRNPSVSVQELETRRKS